MGRFCNLNFTQFCNPALDKRVVDCNSQMEKKSPSRICNRHFEKNAKEVPMVISDITMLNSDNFLHCFIRKLRKSLSREIRIKIIYLQRENYLVAS